MIKLKLFLQYAELLAIDWIMETRLSLWELEYGNFDSDDYYSFVPVDSTIMSKFQDDLNLLRCLTAEIPVSLFKCKNNDILLILLNIFSTSPAECTITYFLV